MSVAFGAAREHRLVLGGMASSLGSVVLCSILILGLAAADVNGATPGVKFREVAEARGIIHDGEEFTSLGWVDFDKDGLEDLWLGHHFARSDDLKSKLYLNKGRAGFVNFWPQIHASNFRTDAHGAHWSDFDHDGDQDLIVVAGGMNGRFDFGAPNLLFVNEESILYERADEADIVRDIGRGRFGVWYDWDRDGRLDFAQINAPRKDGRGKNFLLKQNSSGVFDILKTGVRWPKEYTGSQLLITGVPLESAPASLIQPLRVAPSPQSDSEGFDPTTRVAPATLSKNHNDPLPLELFLSDGPLVAPADFNGDGRIDLFAYGEPRKLKQPCHIPANSGTSVAFLLPASYVNENSTVLTFRVEGLTTLAFKKRFDMRLWRGKSTKPKPFRSLRLNSANKRFRGRPDTFPDDSGMHVRYRPHADVWQIRTLGKWGRTWLLWVKPDSELATVEHSLPRCERKSDSDSRLLIWTESGYRDRTREWDIPDDLVCRTTLPGDYDNDMDIDLYLACSTKNEDLADLILWNIRNDHFEARKVFAAQKGEGPGFYASVLIPSQLAATADFNNDGFLDVAHSPGVLYYFDDEVVIGAPIRLLQNVGNRNNWVQLELVGRKSNRDGIGARVLLTVGKKVQLREQSGKFNAYAQSSKRLHFGLGRNKIVDRIIVYWDSGSVQIVESVAPNQILQIEEPRAR